MRILVVPALLLTLAAAAQNGSSATTTGSSKSDSKEQLVIAAGTKVPVALKHAISTKGSREGDAVYAETTFPVVENDRVLIPANTYVQGRISQVKRAGRVKGRAEVLIHFTSLIYPNGYTVLLPGAVENAPGVENTEMKGEEGSIRAEGQKAKDIGQAASTGATGAAIGGISAGGKGALIGAGAGGALGTAIALLTRGNDVRLEPGTTLEMVIQRPVSLDASRIPAAK